MRTIGILMRHAWAATAAAAAFLIAMSFSGLASAQSAHFVKQITNNGIDSATFTDSVSGKVAGLGNDVVFVTAAASATGFFACQNNGGNFPTDPKKQQFSTQVSNTQAFHPRNGQITYVVTLSPPPSTLACPGGQHDVVVCIQYEDKQVGVSSTDPQGGTPSFDILAPRTATPTTASVILVSQFTSECQALFGP
jgi:hypothetical protein